MDRDLGFNNVAIRGQISSNFRIDKKDASTQFSLKASSGVFFIKTYGLENSRLCEGLKRGQIVNIIGELHSFVFKRCGSHHVYIKALTVIPDDDSPAFRQLITLLGVEAALRKRRGGDTGE